MKRKISCILGIIFLFALAVSSSSNGETGRALSLKVLEKRAERCIAEGNYYDEIFQFCGITKILGYVIDGENDDIVLIGKADNTLPPLYFEDFVIALRNTQLKYAPLEGNTYIYSSPSCSIDPEPEVLNELQQVGNQIFNDSNQEKVQKNLNEWKETCGQSQTVSVMGIPFETRFGKVMVDADYYMKRLVDGSVSLDIDGFKSLTDMTLDVIKEDITNNKPLSIPSQTMNRFWFCPGETSFIESDGIVLIKKSQVILLTEEEYLTKKGKVAGSGRPNQLAKEFVDSFTKKYDQIAREKPIYSELEGLFRVVALTKIMKHNEATSEAQITLDYLLNRFPVTKNTEIKRTLPGISNVKEFQHKSENSRRYSILYFWLPSCGGVSININVKSSDIVKDKTGNLLKLKQNILNARPS